MFKRRHAKRQGWEGTPTQMCPKCGAAEVAGDYCPRCRVKISAYQAYLATLGAGARRALAKRRRWFVFKGPVTPPPENWRSTYEQRIESKIYRELRYPATTQGVYLVLLAFHVDGAGRPVGLQLTVAPPNPEVTQSVRTAISRAQPFPLPPAGVPGREDQRIQLALTVTI